MDAEQGLVGRRAAPQRIAAEFAAPEIQLEPHQPVAPVAIDGPAAPQGEHRPPLIGPSDVDQVASGPGARVERPIGWPWGARWRGTDARTAALGQGGHIALAIGHEGVHRGEVNAPPNLGLEEAVEVLDGVLQTQFPRGDEDRGDPQLEAQPADPAKNIRVLVGTLKAGVIVKLRKAGPTVLLPVRDEPRKNRRRTRLPERPRGGEPTVQREPREDVEARSAGQLEVFDHVKQIELGVVRGHRREMPAGRRRRSPLALAAIQGAATSQNAANSAERGHRLLPTRQFRVDRLGTILSEEAILAKRATQAENTGFERRRRAIRCGMPAAAVVTPVHPIEPVRSGAPQPVLHPGEADAEAPGHGTAALTTADSRDQPTALGFLRGFFSSHPGACGVFFPSY